MSKMKILLGLVMSLGFVVRPAGCSAGQTIALVLIAVFGTVVALEELTKKIEK